MMPSRCGNLPSNALHLTPSFPMCYSASRTPFGIHEILGLTAGSANAIATSMPQSLGRIGESDLQNPTTSTMAPYFTPTMQAYCPQSFFDPQGIGNPAQALQMDMNATSFIGQMQQSFDYAECADGKWNDVQKHHDLADPTGDFLL